MNSAVRVACALSAAFYLIGCQGLPTKHRLSPEIKNSIEEYRIDTSEYPSEQFLNFRKTGKTAIEN